MDNLWQWWIARVFTLNSSVKQIVEVKNDEIIKNSYATLTSKTSLSMPLSDDTPNFVARAEFKPF